MPVNKSLIVQAQNEALMCIYCKEYVEESAIDVHLRRDHKIDHDDAVQLLTTLLYSQPLQYRSLRLRSPGPPAEDVPQVSPQHLDQVPVNESDPVTSTER